VGYSIHDNGRLSLGVFIPAIGCHQIFSTGIEKTKKYNILFTSSTPHVAGGETNLLALLDTIDSKKFSSFCLFNPESGLDKLPLKNRVKFIPASLPVYAKKNIIAISKMLFRILLILRHYKINLIYINSSGDVKFFPLIARLLHIPIIIHIHIDINNVGLRWLKVEKADALLFPSQYLRKIILDHSPWIDASKCFYVHNAVDINNFYPCDMSYLRNELGFNPAQPVIGCVGQLKEMKGQHLFLEAIRDLIKCGIKANFIIVGEDNVENGKYEEFLKVRAFELGVANYISFLGYRNDIPEIMNLCDLLVLPTLKESFGRVVIEAMACGTPVVTSAVGGVVEIFDDNGGGLFCKANNVKDLAAKIKYFFDNPDWWEEQKDKALWNVRKRFTQDKHTAAIERHILRLINGKVDEAPLGS